MRPKGYFKSCGYMGFVSELNCYILFASESDYYDFIKGDNHE